MTSQTEPSFPQELSPQAQRILAKHQAHEEISSQWNHLNHRSSPEDHPHWVQCRTTDREWNYQIDRYSRHLWTHQKSERSRNSSKIGKGTYNSRSPAKNSGSPTKSSPARRVRSTSIGERITLSSPLKKNPICSTNNKKEIDLACNSYRALGDNNERFVTPKSEKQVLEDLFEIYRNSKNNGNVERQQVEKRASISQYQTSEKILASASEIDQRQMNKSPARWKNKEQIEYTHTFGAGYFEQSEKVLNNELNSQVSQDSKISELKEDAGQEPQVQLTKRRSRDERKRFKEEKIKAASAMGEFVNFQQDSQDSLISKVLKKESTGEFGYESCHDERNKERRLRKDRVKKNDKEVDTENPRKIQDEELPLNQFQHFSEINFDYERKSENLGFKMQSKQSPARPPIQSPNKDLSNEILEDLKVHNWKTREITDRKNSEYREEDKRHLSDSELGKESIDNRIWSVNKEVSFEEYLKQHKKMEAIRSPTEYSQKEGTEDQIYNYDQESYKNGSESDLHVNKKDSQNTNKGKGFSGFRLPINESRSFVDTDKDIGSNTAKEDYKEERANLNKILRGSSHIIFHPGNFQAGGSELSQEEFVASDIIFSQEGRSIDNLYKARDSLHNQREQIPQGVPDWQENAQELENFLEVENKFFMNRVNGKIEPRSGTNRSADESLRIEVQSFENNNSQEECSLDQDMERVIVNLMNKFNSQADLHKERESVGSNRKSWNEEEGNNVNADSFEKILDSKQKKNYPQDMSRDKRGEKILERDDNSIPCKDARINSKIGYLPGKSREKSRENKSLRSEYQSQKPSNFNMQRNVKQENKLKLQEKKGLKDKSQEFERILLEILPIAKSINKEKIKNTSKKEKSHSLAKESTQIESDGKAKSKNTIFDTNITWEKLQLFRKIEQNAAIKIQDRYNQNHNKIHKYQEEDMFERSDRKNLSKDEFQELIKAIKNHEDLYKKMKGLIGNNGNDIVNLAVAFISAYCSLKAT